MRPEAVVFMAYASNFPFGTAGVRKGDSGRNLERTIARSGSFYGSASS